MTPFSRRTLLSAAAALASAGSAAALTRVLRIAWLKAPNDLTLAKSHGSIEATLAPLGWRVEWAGPFAAAAPAIEALNAGAVDLTVGSSTAFVTARAAGVAMVMFGYQRMDPASEAIIVGVGSARHAITDLVGARVAVNRGGTGEYILVRALAKAAVALESVTRIYLGPTDAGAAFTSGAVDAWAIWDPFLSIALSNGSARVLADGAESGSENAVAYFVSSDFLSANRPIMERVLAVLERENGEARAAPEMAGAIWTQAMGLPAALGARIARNNTPPIGPVGETAARQIEHVADWYANNGIIPKRPEIAAFLVDLSARP